VGLTKKYTKIDLYIPYFLAYRKAGRKPTIPPYSDLIFEINILEIEK
jgi:FKBP-type peptidyl-prolyl cis-trans isomerase